MPFMKYDPDETPSAGRSFVGVLEASWWLSPEPGEPVPADPEAQAAAQRYWAAMSTPQPIWYLRARALDIVRSDGQPFFVSDIIALYDKQGRPLGRGRAHDRLARQFLSLGVSASFAKVGQPESAVGKVFRFQEQEMSYGGFSKIIRLWPVELLPDDYKPETTRTVTVGESAAVSTSTTTAPVLDEETALRTLVEALTGKTPDEVFDVVFGHPTLKRVGKIGGVGVLEGATDNSLVKMLLETKRMALGPDGKLQPLGS